MTTVPSPGPPAGSPPAEPEIVPGTSRPIPVEDPDVEPDPGPAEFAVPR